MNSSLKPSDFAKINCFNSIFQKCEYEEIAQNIMIILKRTGNTFRPLSYKEYEIERKKDGNYSIFEKSYFDKVRKYCMTPERAALFSPEWEKLYEQA